MDSPDYESLSAADKLDYLWERVSSDPYPAGALPTKIRPAEALKVFSVSFNRASFEHVSDELPPGRAKAVHRYGACARVELRFSGDLAYTGVFASGGSALLRLSDSSGSKPLLLGAAIKFLVDGGPSLNFFAIPMETGRPRRGFLSKVLANSAPGAADLTGLAALPARLVLKRFQKTAEAVGGARLYGNYLPLHHLAGRTTDGREIDEPIVPDRMELHATEAALDVVEERGDWRARVGRLKPGATLYELRLAPAIDQPAEPAGELVLETGFVASRYGDERLFFQHDVGPKKGKAGSA